MTKVHVVNKYSNEITEYSSEKDIDLLRIRSIERFHQNEDEIKSKPVVVIELDNGCVIRKYNDQEFYRDRDKLYAPVYDIETCKIESYSMYEEDDILGFVFLGYIEF